MAVPKKRTSMSKKRIRRNIWIKKGYLIAKKASYLSKFTSMINSDNIIQKQRNRNVLNRKVFGFGFLSKNLFNQ
uniref:ribosomal protein L32 n=1 Tax=Juncus compressus TaxID=223661 RepID=UPI001F148DFB|nr:ribosomal protein L32 [Juncus compressus]YP_010291406.1 ribosomal protein L32 [Juncus tenuis]ULQ66759.1 ribosomal protein L32 [Juncus compressus]ULQ67069.1 ribosomal protein L32 [Juncus tenuis]